MTNAVPLPPWMTCSYREWTRLARVIPGIPVRTSIGVPKFWLGYELRHTMPALIPPWRILNAPYDEFRPAYRHRLHRYTLPRLVEDADRIRRAEGAGPDIPIVLLCFEDLACPGKWCHRTLAREFLEQKGQDTLEVGDELVTTPAATR